MINQIGMWPLYTESGLVRPDNNVVENAIIPFVAGKKTGCFLVIPKGPGPVPVCTVLSKLPKPMELNLIRTSRVYLKTYRKPYAFLMNAAIR